MLNTLQALPTDAFVAAAFAELLDDVTNLLTAAQAQKPCDKQEVAFWRRQLNALNKAESYWAQGVRPVLSDSAYLLPSASRPGALVHRLTRIGGILICSCEAGVKGTLCWHHQLACIVERAAELESAATKEAEIGSGPDTTPEAAAAALLAERLEATTAVIAAMRAAQGRSPISHLPTPNSLACDPPNDPCPLGPNEGDELPAYRPLGQRLAAARSAYAYQ